MELFLLHLLSLVVGAGVASYLIVRLVKPLSEYALVIAIGAVVLFGLGLLHSEKVVVTSDVATAASALFPKAVGSACGPADVRNTLCYKEIVYRGFPNRAIVYTEGNGSWHRPDVEGWRGSGVVGSILINAFALACLVLAGRMLWAKK